MNPTALKSLNLAITLCLFALIGMGHISFWLFPVVFVLSLFAFKLIDDRYPKPKPVFLGPKQDLYFQQEIDDLWYTGQNIDGSIWYFEFRDPWE
jgi:hypothetical protein